ncbi:MAG: hypothetical protein U1F56_16375 [Rubrivivax sp.]
MVPAQPLVDLWQLSQLPLTVACSAFDGFPAAPSIPPPWQLAQPLLTATLACRRPLAQLVVLPLWQLSQDMDAPPGRLA